MLRSILTTTGLCLALASSPSARGELDSAIPLRNTAAGTYAVSGDFDGHVVAELMVDTGSSYTTMNERTLEVLRRAGKAVYLKTTRGILADGSRAEVPIYRIASLRIGNCVIPEVETAVFPGQARPILGLSALKTVAPFALSLDPPTLVLSHCAGVPPNGVHGTRNPAHPSTDKANENATEPSMAALGLR